MMGKLQPVPLVTKQPRLIHGNAEGVESYLDKPVDLVVTSPPYNIRGRKGEKWIYDLEYTDHDDSMPEEDYVEWQLDVMNALYNVASDGASFFYNHKVRHLEGKTVFPHSWVFNTPWTVRQEIIWNRGSTHNHTSVLFWPYDERIFWLTKGNPILPDAPIAIPTIWNFTFESDTWHPAPFNIKLPQMCIQAVGRKNITVLDPFCGSGTTLVAACQYGLDCIGIDNSMEYLEKSKRANGWSTNIENHILD